jgi:hypothetical protein
MASAKSFAVLRRMHGVRGKRAGAPLTPQALASLRKKAAKRGKLKARRAAMKGNRRTSRGAKSSF